MTGVLLRSSLALLPVLAFLGALVLLDSFKLVRLRWVLVAMAIGVVAAGLSYLVNLALIPALDLGFTSYSRYVSPVLEETLKAAALVYLIRAHRIGLLVDAAIVGFAIGTGFAVAENLYYLMSRLDPNTALWVVRGFGTAVMHGGVAASFAIASVAMADSRPEAGPAIFLPGFALAVALHSAFNHFLTWPVYSTLGTFAALPVVLYWVFQRSEHALRSWLGSDFDSDLDLLATIRSAEFTGTHVGQYLHTLKSRFRGEVMADLVCYIHLHVELAMRAKGMLMMRESGFEPEVDEETRAKVEELKFLETSIGKTGLRALQPVLQISGRDLWQFYVLEK